MQRPAIPTLRRQYDFPPTATLPRVSYLIAGMSRSGTTYLAHQLWATGVMGAPLEYFNPRCEMLQMAGRLGAQHIREYVQRLFAIRTSPNGVFGFKAGIEIVVRTGVLPLFPDLRCIRITRSDRLAQAVSYAIAEQTDQWSSLGAPMRTPTYDAEHIRRCLARIERGALQIGDLLSSNGLTPMEIRYEDFAADPRAAVDDILRRFGITRDPARELAVPMTERQSGPLNLEWMERFGRETAGGG